MVFVIVLLLFYVLAFWPWGMWDLSSLTRDWTRTPCIWRWNLNCWTAREDPGQHFCTGPFCTASLLSSPPQTPKRREWGTGAYGLSFSHLCILSVVSPWQVLRGCGWNWTHCFQEQGTAAIFFTSCNTHSPTGSCWTALLGLSPVCGPGQGHHHTGREGN